MGRKKKRDHDFAVTAYRVVQEATGQTEKPESKPSDIPHNNSPTKK